ncbi:unnamed protein product, partial [Prorocentrum cordatum]
EEANAAFHRLFREGRRGARDALRNCINHCTIECGVFNAMGLRPGIGGAVVSVLGCGQQQLAEHPPGGRLAFNCEMSVEGRAQCLQVVSGEWHSMARILGVYNPELSRDDRGAILRCWLANAERAQPGELGRLAA